MRPGQWPSQDALHSSDGVRFFALGQSDAGRTLFVVYTMREEKIRIISARGCRDQEPQAIAATSRLRGGMGAAIRPRQGEQMPGESRRTVVDVRRSAATCDEPFPGEVKSTSRLPWSTLVRMKRTNLVLDEQLLEELTRVSGERTYSRAVTKAMEDYLRRHKAGRILELAGSGLWEGDLSEMRGDVPATTRPGR
jgi:Arc/MetJ family transcription regulator